MNNTRNRVRLTESQLHNVITESVKQVLSELDWKTYANAAKKASERGEDRAYDFADAATNALGRKYPNNRETVPFVKGRFDPLVATNGSGYVDYIDSFDRDADGVPNEYHANNDYYDFDGHDGFYRTSYPNGKEFYTAVRDYVHHRTPTDFQKDYEGIIGDMDDFYSGKTKYVKGNGWQKNGGLDESIRRAIRKVLH